VFHAGPFHGLAARFGAAGSGGVGELFLADLLGLSGQEVVLVHMPPRRRDTGRSHQWGHEELVVCVSGQGQLLIENDLVEVQAGAAFRPGAGGVQRWRNPGDGDLNLVRLIPAQQLPEGKES
jgi:mannose-6-phosphate isomerase-like protein (cupin superfamily)